MKNIVTILFTFCIVWLSAQIPCTSHIVLENQINTAPNPQLVLDEIAVLKNSSFIMTKAGNTITIPVVFHIIHNGDTLGTNENISEAVVIDQIERMNIDFAGLNADSTSIPNEFKAFFAQNEIQFCLAKIDPQGNFTTGINRYQYPEPAYDNDSINNFIKPATIWNRNQYLNIWSIAFSGFLATNLVNGYATPPFVSTADSIDGIVLRYDKVGNDISNNKGRTATHEIGHWLGLFHIWGDDNGACTGDDGIADTPNQGDAYYNCPVTPNSCSSNDMYINYMDYTDAECSLMFTEDQKIRMHSVLNGFRDSLQNSSACNVKDLVISEIVSPNGTVCQERVLPIIKIKNIGNISISQFEIAMFIDDVLVETILLNSLLLENEETYIQFESSYEYTQNIIHEVKFTINSLEANEYYLNNTDSLIFNTVNTGLGLSESIVCDFEDTSFPPQFIFIENPDNDITWQYKDISGNQVFYLDNFNNTPGRVDAFTTTDYNISGLDYYYDALTFEYSYKQKNGNTDTLIVYYSLDCGANWIPIKSYFDNDFGSNENNAFFPNTIENLEEIILTDFLPQPLFEKIRFKFENISGGGNNLFIDNINFRVVFGIDEIDTKNISVFPNPTKGQINIQSEIEIDFSISLINSLGEEVLNQKITEHTSMVDIEPLANGMYFLYFKFENSNSYFYKKIVINK